jgi:hypothetical protein
MAGQYRSGKTVYELAPMFGIARQTVGIILRRHGLDVVGALRLGWEWPGEVGEDG